MNPAHSPPPDFDTQASLWAARLNGGNLSVADRAALARWLDERPEHRARLSEYCQLSADLEQRLPALAAADSVDLPSESVPRRSRRGPRWVAATVAAAAALTVFLWVGRPGTQVHNIATPAAHRETVRLVDGSRIELNARTSVNVEITPAARRVRLAGGEAFFSVSPDASRPFTVETPAGTVRVTGTRFEVRSVSEGGLEVLVAEGSVQVHPGAMDGTPPVALTQGEYLVADRGRIAVTTLGPEAIADALAWREGRIVFNGTPVGEALARFGRYHGRGLSASDEAAGFTLGGRYSLDDLNGFLAALEETLPVRVTHDLSGTTRVHLRTNP